MTHELYRTKEDIEAWLKQYKIESYELLEDSEYGYIVNVNSYVELSNKNLKEIKIKFNIVTGYFNCASNKLTTLKGCPKIVKGDFWCDHNKLENLKYCTKEIGLNFDCSHNDLKSLKGCPENINGHFYANSNNLSNIKYCPKNIKGCFNCSNNKIKTLEYFPEKVNKNCWLVNNYELKELQNIESFEELKKVHDSIILNKKLKKEISIDKNIKNVKIKL